jgi:hypothetical protein
MSHDGTRLAWDHFPVRREPTSRVRGVVPVLALVAAVLALAGAGRPPVATAAAGGRPSGSASVVGGTPVTAAGSLAYVANTALSGACSGTVVSSVLVLTAAHCVVDLDRRSISPPEEVSVRTGTVDRSDTTTAQTSAVTRIVVAPGFNPRTLAADAALLQLAAPTASPAAPLLAEGETGPLTAGTAAVVSGWGLLDGAAADAPTVLHRGLQYVQGPAFCGARDPLFEPTAEFCAVDPSGAVTACHGDSGGPLLAARVDGSPVQIGIVSRGVPADEGRCNPSLPSVFTRVDAVVAWVNGWIGALSPPAAGLPPAASPAPTPLASEGTGQLPVAPGAATAPVAAPRTRFFARSGKTRVWVTLSADGTKVTRVRLALRLACRGAWYADLDRTWRTNRTLRPGRTVRVRFPAYENRSWARVAQQVTIRRSADGASLTVRPSATARARTDRLGSCSAAPRALKGPLTAAGA